MTQASSRARSFPGKFLKRRYPQDPRRRLQFDIARAREQWSKLVQAGYQEGELLEDVRRAVKEQHWFVTSDDPLGLLATPSRAGSLRKMRGLANDLLQDLLSYGIASARPGNSGGLPSAVFRLARSLHPLLEELLQRLDSSIYESLDPLHAELEWRTGKYILEEKKKLTLVAVTYLLVKVTDVYRKASHHPSPYALAARFFEAVGLWRLRSTSRKKRTKETSTGWKRRVVRPHDRDTVYKHYTTWKPRLRELHRRVHGHAWEAPRLGQGAEKTSESD